MIHHLRSEAIDAGDIDIDAAARAGLAARLIEHQLGNLNLDDLSAQQRLLLVLVAAHPGGITAIYLTDPAGLSEHETRRHLAHLVAERWMVLNGDGRYQLPQGYRHWVDNHLVRGHTVLSGGA